MKHKINVIDIETYTMNDEVKPYCICIKMNNEIKSFWGTDDIVTDFLSYAAEKSLDNTITFYAHNINFDGLIIIGGIKDKSIFFDVFIRDHNIYWIKILYLKIEIIIRCSYKIIPISVSKLGEMIGKNKKTFPYKFVNKNNLSYIGNIPDKKFFNSIEDYNIFIANNVDFNLKLVAIDYCIQDVEIVYTVLNNIVKIILEYSKKTKIIETSFSSSSISYKIYSKKFDNMNITKKKTPIAVHNYVKNGYYGGRTDVFGNPRDGELIHYHDYKGMFGQSMLQKFPLGVEIPKKSNLNITEPGFHTIRFRCDSYLPFLPVKRDKLFFANGIMIGTYWYEEIINAIENKKCELMDHYSSLIYESEDYVFKEYVDEFTQIRERGLYYKIFGKNMINGLYGSFALNEENDQYIIAMNETEFNDYRNKFDIPSHKKIGNVYILKITKNLKSKCILDKDNKWNLEYRKRNIAYAAIISAKARIKLNNAMARVIQDGGRLLYTDTDSIFASYSDNRLNKKLGDIEWSEVYEDGVFVGSKFYFIKNQDIKLKGINSNEYTFDEIKTKFYNKKDLSIKFNNQLSFTRKDFILKEWIHENNVKINNYDKRIFDDDKKDTRPLEFYPD